MVDPGGDDMITRVTHPGKLASFTAAAAGKGGRFWLTIARWLIEPPDSVVDDGRRRRLRLLSGFLLFLTTYTLIGTLAARTTGDGLWSIMAATTAVYALGYGLSRTGHHSVATIVAVSIPAISSLARLLLTANPEDHVESIMWLALPLLFSGLLLSLRYTIIVAVGYNVAIAALAPHYGIPISSVIQAEAFIFATSVLVVAVAAIRQRDHSEIEQQFAERKRVEQALRASEEKYRALVENASEAIVVTQNDRVVFANAKTTEITGYSYAELASTPWQQFLPADDREDGAERYRSMLEGDRSHASRVIKVTDRAGRGKWLEANSAIIIWRGRPAILSLLTDVTERKLADQRLEKTLADLRRSNAELEQFAYIASHDLQEPLRMVSSYVQLLERRYRGRLDDDADAFIGFAAEGAERMRSLINDLLLYSRVGRQGKPFSATECEDVLAMALDNLQVAVRESGAAITHDELPTVRADPSQLVQLFQNLVGNAIKFHGSQTPRVHISARHDGDEWVFSVRDSGMGIAPEYHERIFRVFQRLHSRAEYPGTGIGLSLCRRIVERHGGRIWVESEPGAGATFLFTMPVEGENRAVSNEHQADRHTAGGGQPGGRQAHAGRLAGSQAA